MRPQTSQSIACNHKATAIPGKSHLMAHCRCKRVESAEETAARSPASSATGIPSQKLRRQGHQDSVQRFLSDACASRQSSACRIPRARAPTTAHPATTPIPPRYGIAKTCFRRIEAIHPKEYGHQRVGERGSGLVRERKTMRLERLRRARWAGKSAIAS